MWHTKLLRDRLLLRWREGMLHTVPVLRVCHATEAADTGLHSRVRIVQRLEHLHHMHESDSTLVNDAVFCTITAAMRNCPKRVLSLGSAGSLLAGACSNSKVCGCTTAQLLVPGVISFSFLVVNPGKRHHLDDLGHSEVEIEAQNVQETQFPSICNPPRPLLY